MLLETNRLILREFKLDDINDFFEIFGDHEVMRDIEPAFNLDQSLEFLKGFCIEREPKGAFAAVLKESNKLIGYVLFNSVDEPEIYEIGWIFNKNYWRRGYVFEICSRLIRHGFEDMKLHKICASSTDEIKSVPLMKKLGMFHEGTQRKHSKSNEGKWEDMHLYSILAEEFLH